MFWILTPSPMTTVGATYTFWPSTQSLPMRAPDETCEKCQMRVPAPMTAPSSMTAVSWAKYGWARGREATRHLTARRRE